MNEQENLNYSDELIQSTMLKKMSVAKTAFTYIKNSLRFPFKMRKLSDLQSGVYYGLTDHPLDSRCTAPNSAAALFRQKKGLSASSLLKLVSHEVAGNSVIFRGRGYDVYRIRDLDTMFQHRYVFDENSRYEALTLRVDFLRADCYRIRLSRGQSTPENSTPMACEDISDKNLELDITETADSYVLVTSKLRLEIRRTGFQIAVFDGSGNPITVTGGKTSDEFPMPLDSFPLGLITDKKCKMTFGVENFTLYPGEAVFGLGENFGPVNKVGRTVGMWNFEGLGNTSGRVYKNIPFFMSTRGYGVFVNDTTPVTFWVGSRETCRTMFAVENALVDYYFFFGPSFQKILGAYTDLTGKPAVPPKWSFGTWISRISYFSQEQVMAVAKKLRDMKFPSDVIHIDTGWFDEDWRCDWKFNEERFPDPEQMFRETEEMGFRICLWQIPYVLKETAVYKDARKKRALARNRGPFVWLWNYEGSPIDFSRIEGVNWYKEKLQALLKMGAASIKTDFAEQVEPFSKFKELDGRKMHNVYPLLYQKAAFEAIEEERSRGDAVIWARSAWAGAQRYPVHWSGDNSSNHDNLLSCLRGGLSLGLSGFTFWSQDAGGFVGVPDDEVYIRWTQMSIFQSHIRYHGCPPHYKEPWNFEPETQDIVRGLLNIRYRLIPYIYTESVAAAGDGLPLLRHLVIDFQEDPNVYHIEDQFMCGRHIMVAPVMERAESRPVYLPEGNWYDFWSGKKHSGGRWITAKADLKTVPVLVKEGSVIPLAKPVLHTGELTDEGMTLHIYPDERGSAGYTLQDDEKKTVITALVDAEKADVSVKPGLANASVELPRAMKGLTVAIS